MATVKTVNLERAGFAIISSVPGEKDSNDHSSKSFLVPDILTTGTRYVLVKFQELTGDDRYRKIESVYLTVRATHHQYPYTSEFTYIKAGGLSSSFNPETATLNGDGFDIEHGRMFGDRFSGNATITDSLRSIDSLDAVKHGVSITALDNSGTTTIYTNVSGYVNLGEYVKQTISEYSIMVNGSAINSNTKLNRTQNARFTADLSVSYSVYAIEWPEIAAAKFRYRAKGASTYTEVDTGTALSYDMPGNLMPTGEMEFQWTITDVLGQTDTSDWFAVKTENGAFLSTSPTGNAFINRYQDARFSYSSAPGVVGTKFRYRKKGETSYTEADVNDTKKCYILPAGTITEGANFEYQWLARDQYGVNWQWGWFAFNTIEALSTAEIVAPNSSLVDMDEPIVFRWNHIISTGSAQTKAELQKSTDGSTWSELTTVSGAETHAELPEKTLTSGSWYWRVRTYNADGNAGAWSAAAQFIAIASPSTPIITALDNSPRPTIQWQTNEQQAYEIILDGTPKKYYGTEKTWTSPAYLADGEHTIGVRVQNRYGRWSAVGEIILTITNEAGPPIVLTAEGAELWWSSAGAYDRYQIYRDLKLIAETRETRYTDHLGNGAVSYQIRGCFAGSNNYGLSNVVETEIKSEYYIFYDMEGGATLEVKHCGLRNQQVTRNNERDLSFTHVPGYEHPVAERSEFRDEAMNGAAVFFEKDEAEQFNRLSGRLVCVKTPDGKAFQGILNSVEITPIGLRWDCTFKLTCVDAEARYAKVSTATFDINIESGSLIMTTSDSYGGPEFSLNIVGDLEVGL